MFTKKTIRRRVYVLRESISQTTPADPIEQFRESLERTNEKSQELFEKQLSTIAAGGIAITVALIDKIIPIATSKYPGLLYFGWLSLIFTILVNLISHRVSHTCHYATIQEIQRGRYDEKRANRRNRKIGHYNDLTIALLILGIFLIMSFITYNLSNMSKEKQIKIQTPPTETRGLQSTAPVAQPKPSTQTTKK